MGMSDVHCILLGSQQFISSEQNGSPGEQDPREGSQHLTPLKLLSPKCVGWLSEPTTKAEMKTKHRNIFALLLYTLFLDLYTLIQFF